MLQHIKTGLAAIALIWMTSNVMSAQHSENSRPGQELKSRLEAFAAAEVKPEMLRWKSRLDNAMSAEDLAQLNTLRAKAAQVRQSNPGRPRHMGKRGHHHCDTALNGQTSDHRQEMRAIVEELKPLARKYKTTLEGIGDDAQPSLEKWKTQAQGIYEQWRTEFEGQIPEGRKGKMGRHGQFPEGFPPLFGGKMKSKEVMAAHFMLWDGSDLLGGSSVRASQVKAGFQLRNYPNPVVSRTTVEFTLPTRGVANVSLVDNNGRTLTTLQNTPLEPGVHRVEFDLNSTSTPLTTGSYFFRLQFNGTTEQVAFQVIR